MNRSFKMLACMAAALALGSLAVQAQRPRPRNNFITVTTSSGLVNFALRSTGISRGTAPVSITTTWRIGRGSQQLTLYAYFSNPAAALSGAAGRRIPSSNVFGKVGGGPFLPFTGVGPYSAGGSLTIYRQRVRGNRRGTRTDTLDLQIDTTGLNLAPGAYSGILRIQMLAI